VRRASAGRCRSQNSGRRSLTWSASRRSSRSSSATRVCRVITTTKSVTCGNWRWAATTGSCLRANAAGRSRAGCTRWCSHASSRGSMRRATSRRPACHRGRDGREEAHAMGLGGSPGKREVEQSPPFQDRELTVAAVDGTAGRLP